MIGHMETVDWGEGGEPLFSGVAQAESHQVGVGIPSEELRYLKGASEESAEVVCPSYWDASHCKRFQAGPTGGRFYGRSPGGAGDQHEELTAAVLGRADLDQKIC